MAIRSALRCATLLLATLIVSTAADAQIFRAYLASDGNDANPCTLPAPCRLLPAALAAVSAGGDIWILDSANFNTSTVTVSKSVTILAVPGVVGSFVGNGSDALLIDGAGINVRLQNLRFRYLSGGGATKGIVVANATSVTLENCDVSGFPSYGLAVNSDTEFSVSGSAFFRNNTAIFVTGAAKGTIARTKISSPPVGYGIYAAPAVFTNAIRLNISDTEIAGGVMGYVTQTGSNVMATITRSVFADCGQCIQQQGSAGSIISVSNSVVTGAAWTFVNMGPQSAFETFQNNVISGPASASSGTFTNRTYQ